MKILMLSGLYGGDRSGVADYSVNLVRALRERGLDLSVMTLPGRLSEGERLLSLPGWNVAGIRKAVSETVHLRPDIFHIQYQAAVYGNTLFPFRLASELRRLGIPLMVTFHDTFGPYLFPKAGKLRKLPLRGLAMDADGIIVSNSGDLDELRALSGQSARARIMPIGPGILPVRMEDGERDALRRRLCGEASFVVGHFGFIHKLKGVETMLDAFALALQRVPLAHLLIVSGLDWKGEMTGYQRSLAARAVRLGIERRLSWLPTMPADDVSRCLQACDVMVMPFRDGISGRRSSFTTAVAHGLPVITTPGENMSPQFRHGDNLWLSSPVPGQMAEGIIELAGDEDLRRHLASGAGQLAGEFSWERIAAEHVSFYGEYA